MTMRPLLRLTICAAMTAGLPTVAFAACSGAAPQQALDSFNGNPAAFLDKNGGAPDLGAQATALGAAAVNSKDGKFGKSLNAMLGGASREQGAKIGKGLGGLGATCSDPNDPSDTNDKKYISSTIRPNILANAGANDAYASADTPAGTATAATSGGGGGAGEGGGGGVAPSGPAPQAGASNGSAATGGTSQSVQTSPASQAGGSAGATGATSTTGSNTVF